MIKRLDMQFEHDDDDRDSAADHADSERPSHELAKAELESFAETNGFGFGFDVIVQKSPCHRHILA